PNGDTLRIRRITPAIQPSVYTPGDRFPAQSHERTLDRLAMVVQEVAQRMADFEWGTLPPELITGIAQALVDVETAARIAADNANANQNVDNIEAGAIAYAALAAPVLLALRNRFRVVDNDTAKFATPVGELEIGLTVWNKDKG